MINRIAASPSSLEPNRLHGFDREGGSGSGLSIQASIGGDGNRQSTQDFLRPIPFTECCPTGRLRTLESRQLPRVGFPRRNAVLSLRQPPTVHGRLAVCFLVCRRYPGAMPDVTELLAAANRGDTRAAADLLPLV